MFGSDRNEMRSMFYSAWEKFNQKALLQPLEQVIVGIIQLHPEYHSLLENDDNLTKDYTPEMGETNPFLHMSMHIAIQEQLSTNRPANIRDTHEKLCNKLQDPHQAEHAMMECLGQMIWQAQRDNAVPNEQNYIECLKNLI